MDKKHECLKCGNVYSNRHNLSRHKKGCKRNSAMSRAVSPPVNKMLPSPSSFGGLSAIDVIDETTNKRKPNIIDNMNILVPAKKTKSEYGNIPCYEINNRNKVKESQPMSEESGDDTESDDNGDDGKVDAYRIHILQFLPCSVEELPKLFIERYKKLKEGAHCTEFKCTLYNQLMGLADELLNRKDITEEEYNDVIDELSSIS